MRRQQRLQNVLNLLNNPNFTFIEHDITNPLAIDEKLDQIYNLACPASPPAYQGSYSIKTTQGHYFANIYLRSLWISFELKLIVEMSTPLAFAPVMMKASTVQKACSLIITDIKTWILKLCAFSIRMAPIWILMMAGLFQTSSVKPFQAKISPFMEQAIKPDLFAMLMI